ncbi:MAG: uroporphyrinogen-III synthase [Gemmatimonadaceae bacterium]|nr:uroporphyrinogen-III synthase [Chitinophagaceae bacterium]
MPDSSVTILCTRPVDDSFVEAAAEVGIDLQILSFIDTEPVLTIETQQEIEHALTLSTAVVFTSMNAVEAVATLVDGEQPDWMVYCMGNTTKKLAEKYFGKDAVAATGEDASDLADSIIADDIGSVVFFCGDVRRNELPDKLEAEEIEVTEIVVYETIFTPHKIKIPLNGLIFFSPTAVKSFFSVNKVAENTIIFAIGKTTASEVSKFCKNKIIIAAAPAKDQLVEEAITYFS